MPERMLIVNPARRPAKRHKVRARNAKGHFVMDHGGRVGLKRPKKGTYTVNPARRRRRAPALRFMRNPIPRAKDLTTSIMQDLTGGALGAVGGVLIDLAAKPLPLDWKVGAKGYLVKGTAAIAIGVLGSMFKVKVAAQMATGAMAVVLYTAAKEHLTGPMGLGEFTADDAATMAGLGELQTTDAPMMMIHPITGQQIHVPAHLAAKLN